MSETVHGIDHRDKGSGPPLVGALLRRPFLAARGHIVRHLHAEGFPDLAAAHLAVFQHPGPDGRSPGEIARGAGATKQAVNNLLAQLERSGYLRREINPANRRERVVRLTERGNAAVGEIRVAVAGLESEWRLALGDRDYARMRALLQRLNDVLRADDEA